MIRCWLSVAVRALEARLAVYPDIHARHAFLGTATVPSHQSTLARLHRTLHTLHNTTAVQTPSHPAQRPLSYATLQGQLATYHATQHSQQQQLKARQATLNNQLATLATHLATASAISQREADPDGELSAVGSMHPSELVGLFGRVSDAVDAVGERCNAVLVEEEQVRRMKLAAKGRRWNEAAVMRAVLKRPDELRQAEAELRQRLGDGDSNEGR